MKINFTGTRCAAEFLMMYELRCLHLEVEQDTIVGLEKKSN